MTKAQTGVRPEMKIDDGDPYRSPAAKSRRLIPYFPGEPARVELLKSRWLYRRLRFQTPLQMELEYDAFGLFDEIRIDGHRATRTLPIVHFTKHFDFFVPTDLGEVQVQIDLKFAPFAWITSFRVRVGGVLVYDEKNGKVHQDD